MAAQKADNQAAVAELRRLSANERAALDRAADACLAELPDADEPTSRLQARAIGLLTRAFHTHE